MKLLIVDDEPGLRQTLARILGAEGHECTTASDGEEAMAQIAAGDPDLLLCDLRMPAMGGLELIDRHRAAGGRALIIAMSAYGDVDTAVEAMRRGAYDYIQKPFRADEVILCVRKAEERERLRARVEDLEHALGALRADGGIVGRSPALQAAVDVARKVARHPSSVLITGESGTGKELIARLIHDASPRAARPFVAVNCAAIPAALLESELFGHVRGSFTGATGDKRGLFEVADTGTIFLDEIGELPPALQVKLLRVLQESEVRPVGATASRRIDARLISATNRDLAAEVAAGRFRDDLYWRINVVAVRLPPLRERREDIPELVRHFLQRHRERLGLAVDRIAPAAQRLLIAHAWPGNVRELENVIERALVLATGPEIGAAEVADLVAAAPFPMPSAPGAGQADDADGDLSVKRRTVELERGLIRRALERTGGNRTRAAQLLDLSHRALLYKIRDYGLGD